jgi:hypothetical protein
MSNCIAGRALVLACLIVAVTACPASAQLGRLGGAVKKQVKEAAGLGSGSSADAVAPSSASSGPRFGSFVLEMTPQVLDRVESVARAVADAGPRPAPMRGDDSRREAQARALESAELNQHQYGILKERIIPFCRRYAAEGEGPERIPGQGRNVYYVYAASEIEALQPRCGELLPLLEGA